MHAFCCHAAGVTSTAINCCSPCCYQASHAAQPQPVPVGEQLWEGTLQKLVAVSFRLLSWRQGMQLSRASQQLQARAQ